MPSSYRAIFTAPGTVAFSAAGFLGRMPLAMMGLGVMTMVSEITGRYGLAGSLSATMAVSAAALGPQVSRLVDRHGQRRVLRPTVLVSLLAATGLVLCAQLRLADWTLFLFAAGVGCVPSVGAMTRARWAALYRQSPRELHTAYSFESVVDEVCFIFGPIIAVGLSTTWFPAAGPVLAGGFLAVGVWWLTSQRATEPVPHPAEHHTGGSVLRSRGLQVLVAAFVATGAIFGSVDVVTVAFAEAEGHKSWSSLVLAVYALGSCLAGAVFGLLHLKGEAPRRWLVGVCAMAVSMIPLQLAGNLPVLAAALFVAGLAIAPTMVTTMALVQAHVPRAKLTEGMSWTSTGLAVGIALGASTGGWVVDAHGAAAGYAVPGVAGVCAAVVGLTGYRLLRPAPPAAEPTREGLSDRDDREQDPEQSHLA
ncbi:MFS transporter [Streptomyces solincola]|uniref:MFS transporter n=1 Tax=Streptomyces solincola TaxID=2100817 RepID=A0A2S9Q311_9ACTN|nr:MFS transporter [Streptomyces solincola]PRH80997.1 MFS transporter [Streptomyces solincola]